MVRAGLSVPDNPAEGYLPGELIAVDDGVVAFAEQGCVVEICQTAVDPVDQMVCIAPRCWG